MRADLDLQIDLLAEYEVMQISAQQVQLKHLPSKRDISLAVPAAGPPSR